MTNSAMDGLPELDGFTTTVAEMLEAAKTTTIATSERGIEVLAYAPGQRVLNGRQFNKTVMWLERLDAVGITEGQAREDCLLLLPAAEPELRARMRRAFAGMMRPSRIAKLKDTVVDVVEGAFDEAADSGTMNFVDEIAWRVPSRMYCELVAMPREFAPKAARLSESFLAPMVARDSSRRQLMIDSLYETYDLVSHHMIERREDLGDDFASQLIRQVDEGNLTEKEMMWNATGLLHASIDNTSHQAGLALGMLLERRDVWERVVENPDLIPAAIDEASRLLPRSNSISRRAEEDVEIEGHQVAAGTDIFVSIPAAHQDPRVMDDPTEFRLDRPPFHPLHFGGGNYNCLGQHLARLEMQVMIHTLATRFPNAHLANGWQVTELPFGNEIKELQITLD